MAEFPFPPFLDTNPTPRILNTTKSKLTFCSEDLFPFSQTEFSHGIEYPTYGHLPQNPPYMNNRTLHLPKNPKFCFARNRIPPT